MALPSPFSDFFVCRKAQIVPAHPTPVMIQAGVQLTGLSEDMVRKLYLVMLSLSDEDIPEQKN